MYLEGYRPHDLHPLSHFTQLKRLRLKHYPNVRTLDGIQAFTSLNDLLVAGARCLTNICALTDPRLNALGRLDLSTCRKIADLEPIASRRELTHLSAANCGDLPTVAPLADLTRLEALYLYASTNIVDGDLTPIAHLPRLRDFSMQNRRHYHPSVPAIQELVANR